jgi:hypothetical protein
MLESGDGQERVLFIVGWCADLSLRLVFSKDMKHTCR